MWDRVGQDILGVGMGKQLGVDILVVQMQENMKVAQGKHLGCKQVVGKQQAAQYSVVDIQQAQPQAS